MTIVNFNIHMIVDFSSIIQREKKRNQILLSCYNYFKLNKGEKLLILQKQKQKEKKSNYYNLHILSMQQN